MYTTIKTLRDKGFNKGQIAKMVGHDWKTVDKVFKELDQGKEKPKAYHRKSKLDPFKESIIELLEQGLSGIRIHEELSKSEYSGTYSSVKKYVRKLKKNTDVFVRIHTDPGKEAQVDFGYVGLTTDNNNKKRKTWVFNMRLSYSRYDYYEKVYDQKVETFIQCHINAFQYFGGVPAVVKIDNLKAAILEASFYEPIFQQLYKTFAQYYGFSPVPCRVYRPNDKGKVESGIKYVKSNFFKGRTFLSGDDLDRRLQTWLQKANNRVHGTTRKIPFQLFTTKELGTLMSLPEKPYRLPEAGTRFVYHDCHIFVKYNYYSVPFEYVGKTVEIELDGTMLRIYFEGDEIAIHPLLKTRGEFSTVVSHYPKYKIQTETELQERYELLMAELGESSLQMFYLILSQKREVWIQTVQGILSLKKTYSDEVINKACKRALLFNAVTYLMVKNICKKGTYDLPQDASYSLGVDQ